MNNKVAKLLRKMADFIPSAPREYKHTTMKTVMVDTGKMDAEGKAIMLPQARVTTAAVGERPTYQQLKRSYLMR